MTHDPDHPGRRAGHESRRTGSPATPPTETGQFKPGRPGGGPAAATPGEPARRFRPAAPPRPRPATRIPIPRSQQWMFWSMLMLVVAMSVYLIRLRERASDHFAAAAQPLPFTAADTHEEPLRLYLANDADGSLVEKPIVFPLPSDPNTRARVVLDKLLAEYFAPGSPHPLHPLAGGVEGTGVEGVYLLPVPGYSRGHGQLAVVNLTTAFVHNHPSGLEPETLTLLSMIATLRANLPSVTQVRFLVDGQQLSTLAGHADLTRAYLAANTAMSSFDPPGSTAPGTIAPASADDAHPAAGRPLSPSDRTPRKAPLAPPPSGGLHP